eukprot:SAG11_NODE_13051_length_672_cov_1.073298_1_plen_34_part_10
MIAIAGHSMDQESALRDPRDHDLNLFNGLMLIGV